mmetsp:Transcript_7175/g.19501  ORF Transcript_7175/g.19501 Transcript_7175/m.19501 type:complete len:332 (-) Transcript_7175:955-1950(-)
MRKSPRCEGVRADGGGEGAMSLAPLAEGTLAEDPLAPCWGKEEYVANQSCWWEVAGSASACAPGGARLAGAHRRVLRRSKFARISRAAVAVSGARPCSVCMGLRRMSGTPAPPPPRWSGGGVVSAVPVRWPQASMSNPSSTEEVGAGGASRSTATGNASPPSLRAEQGADAEGMPNALRSKVESCLAEGQPSPRNACHAPRRCGSSMSLPMGTPGAGLGEGWGATSDWLISCIMRRMSVRRSSVSSEHDASCVASRAMRLLESLAAGPCASAPRPALPAARLRFFTPAAAPEAAGGGGAPRARTSRAFTERGAWEARVPSALRALAGAAPL